MRHPALGESAITRITLQIAAVHESLPGTFETCRRTMRMSADRGRPEVTGPIVKTALMIVTFDHTSLIARPSYAGPRLRTKIRLIATGS